MTHSILFIVNFLLHNLNSKYLIKYDEVGQKKNKNKRMIIEIKKVTTWNSLTQYLWFWLTR